MEVATAAAVTEVCTAAAARVALAWAWAKLRQRARCAARAEARWTVFVGRRGLSRWRAAATWRGVVQRATLTLAWRLRGALAAALLHLWYEAAAARRVARERQRVARWLWARLEAVAALATLRRHVRSCARRRRALLLLPATAVARWRIRASQRSARAAMVARAVRAATLLAARRAWAQWWAAHQVSLRCEWARLRREYLSARLRRDAAWRTWLREGAARRAAAATAARGVAASLRCVMSRWRRAEYPPLLACRVVASRSGGAAASVARREFALWARAAAASHTAAVAVAKSTGQTRGWLEALRVGRAFGVWAGGAAAFDVWSRAAAARWARSQSWAFMRWTERAARQREAKVVLLQASVAHRRWALVGAATAWRDATVRRRFLLSSVVQWRCANVVKAFAQWTERALERRDARDMLLRACKEAGLRGVGAPARQLARYAHARRAMARGMAAWHRQVRRQWQLKRRAAARWRQNQVCAPSHQPSRSQPWRASYSYS